MAVQLPGPQPLQFYYREDAEFFFEPNPGEVIDVSILVVELQSVQRRDILATLTNGNGITLSVNPYGGFVKFATDMKDTYGKEILGPGDFFYEVRDPTPGARKVLAWGPFPIHPGGRPATITQTQVTMLAA